MNAASETFSNSMSQIENIGLSIRHFLVSNGDKAEKFENTLSQLSQGITDINDKSNNISTSIDTNSNQLKLISYTIYNFKNDRSAALSPCLEKISEKIADLGKIINETTALQTISDGKLPKSGLDIENSATASNHKNFTIGPNNERKIHNIARPYLPKRKNPSVTPLQNPSVGFQLKIKNQARSAALRAASLAMSIYAIQI